MKLFVRGLFACTALLAGLVLTGCNSPATAGQQMAAPPISVDVARFHVGDTVIVIFSGAPTPVDPFQGPIQEDGTINLPLIHSVYALGKTAGELQNEIQTSYVPKYYVRLTVTVKSGDRIYYVGGEVNSHGSRQPYLDGTTVTKAIQSAGGLTDFANHSKVWLTHASNGQRIRVDYDEALKNPAKDPPVYPDDQINVEKRFF